MKYEQINESIFTTILMYIICIGAELAGAAGARAPPLFNPRPEIYSIKCAQVGFCGENSPKFLENAPALFRAIQRQRK